jgi:hypothetical protein
MKTRELFGNGLAAATLVWTGFVNQGIVRNGLKGEVGALPVKAKDGRPLGGSAPS